MDEKGLPVILERERCKLNVSLQPVSGESTDKHLIAALKTPYGELSAREAFESYNVEWISYFKEFQFHGKPLLADTVTYPERRWTSFDEYAAEKQLSLKEYMAIMEGEQRFPEEYKAQDRPDDWQSRKPSDYGGDAFGSVWVPIDELRKGIAAELTFPRFQEDPEQTS